MNKLARSGLILGGIALALFFTYRLLIGGETVSWHQRLTVTVQTPTGEVSGAAVTAVVNTDTSGPLVLVEARGVRSQIRGEAVVVEVAPGRYLFALLGGAGQWVYPAFGLGQGLGYDESMHKLMGVPHDTPSPLPVEGYPLMVTFTDINDPTTVTKVDPLDPDASFGCDRYDGTALPWRVAGVPFRTWADREYRRQEALEIARRLGLNGPEVEAMAKVFWVWRENSVPAADRAAFDAAVAQLGEEQFYAMKGMDQNGAEKFDIQRPRIEDFSLPTCHSLTAVTLEVTEDPVTEGRVEAVLGWLVEAGMTRFNVAKTPDGNIPLDAFLSIDHWSKQ